MYWTLGGLGDAGSSGTAINRPSAGSEAVRPSTTAAICACGAPGNSTSRLPLDFAGARLASIMEFAVAIVAFRSPGRFYRAEKARKRNAQPLRPVVQFIHQFVERFLDHVNAEQFLRLFQRRQ